MSGLLGKEVIKRTLFPLRKISGVVLSEVLGLGVGVPEVSRSLLRQADPAGVNRLGGVVVEGLMEAFLVVPPEIGGQAVFGIGNIPVVMEIDVLLFD